MPKQSINQVTMKYLQMAQYHGYKYVEIYHDGGMLGVPLMKCRHHPFPPSHIGMSGGKYFGYALEIIWHQAQPYDVYYGESTSLGDVFALREEHYAKVQCGRYDLTEDQPKIYKEQ